MVIRTADGGQRQLRAFGAGSDVIPPASQMGGGWSIAGRRVTTLQAYGLPAVLRGIRVLAETTASLPVIVYRGDPANPDTKTIVANAPQYELLSKKPNGLQTPFAFKAFVVASIEGYGNSYILKGKSRGAVQELWPLDPRRVTPEPEGHTIKYKVRLGEPRQGAQVDMTRADLIHIPGVLLQDPFVGLAPIMIAANAIGTALATEEFAGRFYANDATPGGVLEGSPNSTAQQAKDLKELWEDGHRGSRMAHKIGALFGGAKYQTIGVDAQAAQVIEAQKWGVNQAANALGLPAWILGGVDPNPRSTPEQRNMEFLQFSLAGKLVNIEQALHADDDLFPDKEIAPQFLAEGMLRADTLARYQAYVQGRQAGWLSANDVRKKENMPPIPGGDEYQVTPVGGSPNLQPGQEPGPQDNVPEPGVPVT